ncbi:MAG: CPBP family glutamic-type intramembrane protease, partial [Candidatus Binatia bacterium]
GDPLSDQGLEIRFRPPSFRRHLALGALLLVFYGLAHVAVSSLVLHQTFAPRMPARLGRDLVVELLAVGIPEEVFFRGYLQNRWNRLLGRPWRILGAPLGLGLLVQAVAFACCHVASGDWWRLSVFFFALLAGWLRERSGSIFPGAAYHAVANVWYRTLVASFR